MLLFIYVLFGWFCWCRLFMLSFHLELKAMHNNDDDNEKNKRKYFVGAYKSDYARTMNIYWTTSDHLHISFIYELIWKEFSVSGLEKSLWANLYACQGTRALYSSAVSRTLSLLSRCSFSEIYLKISFHHRQTMLIKSDKNDWYCVMRWYSMIES